MPGAVTEPKTSPWKVLAQNAEERIKFKHNNSRITLALRNAKIHRPGLNLHANRTSNCSTGSESTAQLNRTLCNRNSNKTKSSKRADRVKCNGPRESKNISETLSSGDASGRTVSKLDSIISRCSYKITMNSTECKKSGNPLEEADGNLAKTVKLKTVNLNPWTNDGLKTARNVTRLVSLLQECSDEKNCSSEGREGTASQKLLKPGRIVCSHEVVSRDCQMGENCLSGILLVTSKIPSNPWSFGQLPRIGKLLPNKVKSDFSVFERGPRLSTMKKCCHLCKECRKTFQNVSSHGPDMESENLIRLKYKLKLKEGEMLNMESDFGKTVRSNSNELVRDEQTKCKLREKLTLPKLYLMHHSTAIAEHQKAIKTRTKMIDSIVSASEERSIANATKQRCYKQPKVQRLDSSSSPQGKLAKKSAKMPKVQEFFSAVLLPTTPLRGFTPVGLTESPMLWRENESEVQGIKKEEEMTIKD